MQCYKKDLTADVDGGLGGRCVPKVMPLSDTAHYCENLLPKSDKGKVLVAERCMECSSCGSCAFDKWKKSVKDNSPSYQQSPKGETPPHESAGGPAMSYGW